MQKNLSSEQLTAIIHSIKDPSALIGWRILVKGVGIGVIISIVKRRFHTTKYTVRFDDGHELDLALRRSRRKGKVPFTFISKVN